MAKTAGCSIRFAKESEKLDMPFGSYVGYETEFVGQSWRTQMWTVVFLGMLGPRANCFGVELWKNWFIDKRQAKNRAGFMEVFRKRLILEKFEDAIIYELIEPMSVAQFQKWNKRNEDFNKLCTEAVNGQSANS